MADTTLQDAQERELFELEIRKVNDDRVLFERWPGAAYKLLAMEGCWQGWRMARRAPSATPRGEEAEAAVRRALDCYAESYDRMAKMGDGKIRAGDVAYDIRCNMVASVNKALKGRAGSSTGEAEEDAARLDWLEQRGNEGAGLFLHPGEPGEITGKRGLGLSKVGRTLRQAIDAARASHKGSA